MHKTYLGQLLLVGLGGFIGSAARFGLSGLVHRFVSSAAFPYGTLVVNVSGCLFIGFLGAQMDHRQVLGPAQRLFLLVGVLGGFTTFSTLSYETLRMAHAAEFARVAANLAAHVVLGLVAAWIGFAAGRSL